MEERQTRIDEKPATYKKKGQLYLIVAVGTITLFLFINMIYNIVNHNKKEDVKKAEPTAQQKSAADNDPDRFQKLLNNREKSLAQGDKSSEPKKSPFDVSLPKTSSASASGATGEGSTGTGDRKKDLIGDVEARFKAQEVERALKARQTRYADSGEAISRPASSMGTSSTSSLSGGKNNNAQRIAELDQQRSALQSRISMIEAQGVDTGAQGLAAAKADLAAQQKIAGGAVGGGDFGGSSTASKVPSGVVGYPADNEYQASVEGKEKLPVGAEINAITTYTAISDYTGGTMKAMITHDVYDATNSYILAPKGSQLTIKAIRASGVNEVIQNRLAFTVQWLVLPDGNRIDFRKASVLDRMGTPAVEGDEVDRHLVAQIMGVAAYALVGTKTSYEGSGDGNESFAGNFGEGARNQASGIAQKYLQIVPTVTLHAGAPIRIITEDEMFIKPWKVLYENYVN
ncbi:TPA: TrbI/VirB10 family protein [Klebsiella pneumoniae]|jgi:type IV secretion system protein VirB10|uniref:Bacterial conjugation TrbI-like protein n=11 Tax=Gammaproteobacteria TaxID=1236 RepID=A0A088DA34_ACIBA|nr:MULTISPECIES: TrbI/VirB10 family protein [Gammaproteobacteria]EAX7630454.1 TrbI/VirB10 family protein [Salmonella enterica]EBU7272545.1 conjugal transfer protein TrbI [Salmonella enterica subsp. enterica serovar Heidelberg]EBW7236569.1 conjugal transfer protein TrbI [Salmonella enterica subsp. enterica serovar Senftenberg]ECN3995716.1 TrbI/VirB10 family protein [Salmonella enterica subsp. enterica serovar Infantis]EDL3511949.1 conjugal transfer protein TrbI [Salmonella enterica subsp. enter